MDELTTCRQSVCGCLIVKNEDAVIRRCLDSLRGMVNCVVIVDTGSTDNTIAVIRDIAREYPVPIHLHERPWKDFAHNRTELLCLASPLADYMLMIDADATVEGCLPERLTADGYELLIDTRGFQFRKVYLMRSALPWRYEGVVHEFPVCEQAQVERLDTLIIKDYQDGGHRIDHYQPRLESDVAILEEALSREPANLHYRFYLATTTDWLMHERPNDPRAAEWYRKAIANYRQRTTMGRQSTTMGRDDFNIYSLRRLGLLLLMVNDEEGLTYSLEAWRLRPDRWEPVHEAAMWLNHRHRPQEAYALTTQTLATPPQPVGLYIWRAVYDYYLLFDHAIAAFGVGRDQECLDACKELLTRQLPPSIDKAVRGTLRFAESRLAGGVPAAPAQALAS